MGIEIEHKYLVVGDTYRLDAIEKIEIVQGFLSREPDRTVRIRISQDKGYITIKGKGAGASHPEFEYEIPLNDAQRLLLLCEPPLIEKTRHIVVYGGNRWEVDEFHSSLQGLAIAELEVPSEDYHYELPPFVGREVTGDQRYYNSQLGTV